MGTYGVFRILRKRLCPVTNVTRKGGIYLLGLHICGGMCYKSGN